MFNIEDVTFIRAFFSVPQNWEIINTAVLTGKQISHAMKVFVVSYAGKISDVTRQSVCQIEDDSVLKVITRHMCPSGRGSTRARGGFVPSYTSSRLDRRGSRFQKCHFVPAKRLQTARFQVSKKKKKVHGNKPPRAFGVIFLYA